MLWKPCGLSASGSMSYDLAGNMLSNGQGQSYQWDAEKRLTKITYADSRSTEFFYDDRSQWGQQPRQKVGAGVS